jgi:predicted nucleic acid-binding protein
MRPDEHFRDATISTKIVVADTSPLNYLVQINCEFLIPLLYRRVIIPPTVVAELGHSGAPPLVSQWVAALPPWIEVLPPMSAPDAKLSFLGLGERDAIQLALELGILTILIDEQKGRHEASSRGLTTTGTIGVLIAGHKAGLINARDMFDRLIRVTTFRSTSALRQNFLETLNTLGADGR